MRRASERKFGSALRDLSKPREARDAYDQAARLYAELLRESPDKAGYQVALANTLLNTTTLLAHLRAEAEAMLAEAGKR